MRTATSVSTLAATLAALLCLAGCNADGAGTGKNQTAPPPRNPMEVKVAPALMEQIRIGEPEWAAVRGNLRVPGRVEADETRVARVGSPVTGRIAELEVQEGQAVRRGQVLAVLHSTELSDSQFGYLRAFSQQQLAQRAAARARQLLQAGVIGEAELQRRDAEFQQASAEVATWRDQLKVLGLSETAIRKLETTRAVNSLYEVVASIDGTVLERKMTVGQVVQPADTVFVVADLSHVWLVADVPEQAVANVAVGKAVRAEVSAYPDQQIPGVLSFVGATVNPDTRTVRARMNLPNPDSRYKPAMLAMMILEDRAERLKVIPSTAVVREGNQDHVFVQAAPGTFLLKPVALGPEFGDKRVLTSELRTGEKIVIDGAFHLNNERKHLALQGE
jgi:membrane fusion protein, heavy metal efflux system